MCAGCGGEERWGRGEESYIPVCDPRPPARLSVCIDGDSVATDERERLPSGPWHESAPDASAPL